MAITNDCNHVGNSEGEDSDDDWDKDNEGGAELDLSLYVVDTDRTNNNRRSKQVQGELDVGKVAEVVKRVMAPILESQAKKNDATEEILGRMATVMDMQHQESRAQAEERNKEKESRKRKQEQDEPDIKEDEVTIVEQTLEIRDDSNAIIDIKARSLLGEKWRFSYGLFLKIIIS